MRTQHEAVRYPLTLEPGCTSPPSTYHHLYYSYEDHMYRYSDVNPVYNYPGHRPIHTSNRPLANPTFFEFQLIEARSGLSVSQVRFGDAFKLDANVNDTKPVKAVLLVSCLPNLSILKLLKDQIFYNPNRLFDHTVDARVNDNDVSWTPTANSQPHDRLISTTPDSSAASMASLPHPQ